MAKEIYCVGCQKKVAARLTTGVEIYPHRGDLKRLPFWKCDACKNYVGCHHKTNNPTHPLGNIPTAELRNARKHIHALLDPIWKQGLMGRTEIYAWLSVKLGWKYHTAQIRSVDEARAVYQYVKDLSKEIQQQKG